MHAMEGKQKTPPQKKNKKKKPKNNKNTHAQKKQQQQQTNKQTNQNKKSKCYNDPYSLYLQDFFTVISFTKSTITGWCVGGEGEGLA